MREFFPTNTQAGQRLSASWVRNVGQRLSNYGQFNTGNLLSGMRLYGVTADQPRQPYVMRQFIVDGIYSVDGTAVTKTRRIDIGVGEALSTDWAGNIVRWNEETQLAVEDAAEYRQRLGVAPLGEQFLIDRDDVWAFYDYLHGKWMVPTPPSIRYAKVLSQDFVKRIQVEVLRSPDEDINNILGSEIRLHAFLDPNCGLTVKTNDLVVISYVEPFSTWFITFVCRAGERKIHFQLQEALTVELPFVSSRIELDYGRGSGTIGQYVSVWNPPRGCGTGTYRFSGASGCRGLAISDPDTDKLWVAQLDCA